MGDKTGFLRLGHILSCQLCQDHLPSHPKEPLMQKPKPLRPFQEIAVDFCSYGGCQFLILIDCHMDWPEIIPMGHNSTTHHLITALRQHFVAHQYLTSYGVHNLQPTHSETLQRTGVSHTTPHSHDTHSVTAR